MPPPPKRRRAPDEDAVKCNGCDRPATCFDCIGCGEDVIGCDEHPYCRACGKERADNESDGELDEEGPDSQDEWQGLDLEGEVIEDLRFEGNPETLTGQLGEASMMEGGEPHAAPRKEQALFQQGPLRFGVVTWNVNHFSETDDHPALSDEQLANKYQELLALRDQLVEAVKTYKADEPVKATHKMTTRASKKPKADAPPPQKKKKGKRKKSDNPLATADIKITRLVALGRVSGWRPPAKMETETGEGGEALALLYDFKECEGRIKAELKRRALPLCIAALFDRNPWLHAILLQEVNSYEVFCKRMDAAGLAKKLDYEHQGPHMVAAGGTGQPEFYPLVLRRGNGVTHVATFAIDKTGTVLEKGDGVSYSWDKSLKNPTFRPIVVYVVEHRGAKLHLGVVHTTPGTKKKKKARTIADEDKKNKGDADNEFYRPNEYAQLGEGFVEIGRRVAKDELWIVGGDYYLAPEAVVMNPVSADQERLERVLQRRLTEAGKSKEEIADFFKNKGKIKIKATMKKSTNKVLELAISVEDAKKVPVKNPNTVIVGWQRRDIVRNFLKLTMQCNLPVNLAMSCAVSASNLHEAELPWMDISALIACRKVEGKLTDQIELAKHFALGRIADLYVYDRQHLRSVATGLMDLAGGIRLADGEDTMPCAKFWSLISDHFPVGALFSTMPDDPVVWEPVVKTDKEEAERACAWQNRFLLAYRLRKVAMHHPQVARAVAANPPDDRWVVWLNLLVEVTGETFKHYLRNRSTKIQATWNDDQWPGAEAFAQADEYWTELRRRLKEAEATLPEGDRFDYDRQLRPEDYDGDPQVPLDALAAYELVVADPEQLLEELEHMEQ